MNKIITFVFLLLLVIGFPLQSASAETTDENRSVFESLEEAPIEDSQEHHQESPETISEEQNEAEDTQNEAAEESEPFAEQNTIWIFVQMIAALAFVVFLIYALLRFLNKRSQTYRSTQMLQNIGGVPLGANRSVQIVKVGDRLLVVGVGETIQLLKEIENPDEIDQLLQQKQEQIEQFDQPINKIFGLLKNQVGTKKSPVPFENQSSQSNSDAFKELLSKQLKDVSKSQQKLHDAVRERDK